MSAVFELASNEAMFEREKGRFLASLADVDVEAPAPHRVQSRLDDAQALRPRDAGSGFDNEPDTDPAKADNRAWGREIQRRSRTSVLGVDLIEQARVTDASTIDDIVAGAVAAQPAWAARGGAGRAEVLRAAAVSLAARRADLMQVAASAGSVSGSFSKGSPEARATIASRLRSCVRCGAGTTSSTSASEARNRSRSRVNIDSSSASSNTADMKFSLEAFSSRRRTR